MAYFSPILTVMVGAVKKAATAMARDFNELEHLQNAQHSDGMFAARSLEKAARTLREELLKAKPNCVVVTEKDALPASGSYFLLSPIDGYANFAHGNAAFAISAALIENNAVVDAVVYSPITDEMFFAEKGSGAFKEGFRNHERLRVAGAKNTENALIACNIADGILQKVTALSTQVRISGTAAVDLAYVAAAKVDAAVLKDVHPAALAAGMLLVKESGGYVFTIGDKDIRTENLQKALFGGSIVATNEPLRQKIADFLA